MIHEDNGTWETRLRCQFIILNKVVYPLECDFLKWSRQYYYDNHKSILIYIYYECLPTVYDYSV